jgi:2-polyprenyl-3-methyl-5-hydroxy-6-metoxy-1,4-benzoquinol methylase
MLRRIEQKEEAIGGIEEARKYAQAHRKYDGLMYRAFLKDLKALRISGNYLEIGAGPGFLAVMIAERNPDVSITAVDLSPEMVAVANEYINERKLQDRIHCVVGDVGDQDMMEGLGKFDLVYSTFSLHHWKDPEASIPNLWNAVKDNGILYIHDFKRVWWLCFLPLEGGEIVSIKASYTPKEIGVILQELGITNYKIKTLFPFFLQSIIACK